MDKKEFDVFYCYYLPQVTHLAYGWLNCREMVQDAVSETFLKLYCNFDKLEEMTSQRTAGYVKCTVRNCCIDELRRYHKSTAAIKVCGKVTLKDTVTDRILFGEILNEVRGLPEKYGLPIILTGIFGMSSGEIAVAMGLKPETVRKRLERGRQLLRKRLNS